MELTQQSLLEEFIMAPKIDTPFPFTNEFFPNTWNFTTPFHEYQIQDSHDQLPNNPSFLELISPSELGNINHPFQYSEFEFHPFLDALTSPEFGSFYDLDGPSQMAIQDHQEYAANLDNYMINNNGFLGEIASCNKIEYWAQTDCSNADQSVDNGMNVVLCGERKSKSKKPDGMPSKNLMAERRRRKRLNDRLSMLRSIVPKISKMDRTSILGDTIDYMKELLDKIHKLREEGVEYDKNMNQVDPIQAKELRPNDNVQVRNPPKFDVERREEDTKVEVCCTAKPGLLLSTLSTLDVLGLDIQQCVISCFNDFSFQASCHEVAENGSMVSSEDVKQALFRNAGYGGRCL